MSLWSLINSVTFEAYYVLHAYIFVLKNVIRRIFYTINFSLIAKCFSIDRKLHIKPKAHLDVCDAENFSLDEKKK